MDANKAAAVELAAQKYIKREIVKSGGQFSKNNRALWKNDGMGGAGNGTGMGPYVIAYACIIHKEPSADADDRYPDATLWSRTLPVDGLIFENDVKNSGLHYKDSAIAATENHKKQRNSSDEDSKPVELFDNDDVNELIHKKQWTMASEDSKPAAKPSMAKPAAKSTKAKKVTKPEAKKTTRHILTYFVQKAAGVSLDGPSISSAVALLDSDNENELSCKQSSSPGY